MLQPFVRFREDYIEALMKTKNNFIITQTYYRAGAQLEEVKKENILLTVYDDAGLATIHLKAIHADKYAYMLKLTNEKHVSKMKEMLLPDSKYCFYWSVIDDEKELNRSLNTKYKDNMRRYIMAHTTWRIGAGEKIKPVLQVIFGELFIVLKRGTQLVRVKFEVIEKS